jgi:PASTA domain
MAEVEVQITAPPVNIDELLEFIYELRQAGFSISPLQITQAHNLLITLAAHGYLLEYPQRLSTYLAPVLCSTPEEQEVFYQRFKQWLGRQPLLIADEVTEDEKGSFEEQVTERPLAERPRALLRRLSFPIAAALFILIIALIVWVRWRPAQQQTTQSVTPAASTPTPGTAKATPVPTPTQASNSGSATTATPARPEATQTTPAQTQTPTQQPTGTPQAVASRTASTTYFDLLLAAVLLPLLLVSVWLSWRAIRRLQLERWRTRKKPELKRLPVKNTEDYLFIDATFRRLSQELRRHRLLVTNALDANRTVEATVRAGGMFTPLYGLQRLTPDYLVLIDRSNYRDQQANFDEEIIVRLKREGVFVQHYYFDADPRILRKEEPLSPYLKLQELSALHHEHRLIIFSDGEGLINPLSGEPHRWLEMFADWPFRVILTPELYWGYREQALADMGFIVLPADEDGLAALMEFAHSGRIQSVTVDDDESDYPTLLLQEPQRWLSDRAPEEDVLNQLILQLRYYLGNEGFYLLAACAVYPELLWNITSYYGYHLVSKNKYEETFRALVRLPWMRRGRIPDWLRSRLIASLPPPRDQEIRQLLEKLLISSLQPHASSFELEIARGESLWKRFFTPLKSAFNDWRRGKFLRDFIRTERGRSPLRDYVFLSFMSGSKLAVAFPVALRRLLYRQGQPILGLRRERVFLFAAVVSLSALALTFWSIGKLAQIDPVKIFDFNWNERPPELAHHIYSPWNGARGNQYTLVVKSMEGQKCDLQDAGLQTPSASGITVLSNSVSSDGCQLESQISIAQDAPLGDVDLSVMRGNTLLERLAFEVTETPQPVLPQFTLTVTPGQISNCWTIEGDRLGFKVTPRVPDGYQLYISTGASSGLKPITNTDQSFSMTVTYHYPPERDTYTAQAYIDNGKQRILVASRNYDVIGIDCNPVGGPTTLRNPTPSPTPTPIPSPTPPTCPVVNISCPMSVGAEKDVVKFEANVIGGQVEGLRYNWAVSSGFITDGQGTSAITVKPEGAGSITVTVQAPGFPATCNNKASCTTTVLQMLNTSMVPNVVGMNLDSAIKKIQGELLVVGKISYERSSPNFPSGHVISQDPRAGAVLPIKTEVNLLVAK